MEGKQEVNGNGLEARTDSCKGCNGVNEGMGDFCDKLANTKVGEERCILDNAGLPTGRRGGKRMEGIEGKTSAVSSGRHAK
jgi:hypothetical protein